MIVCHCRAVSDREIATAAALGAREIEDVADACGAGAECHGCHRRIEAIIEQVESRLVLQEAS